MSLQEKIGVDLRQAMKDGDKVTAETLKMLKTDLAHEKAKTGEDLEEEKVLEIVARAAKRRKESIKEFEKAGRNDLADAESQELKVLEKFLPEQMSEKDIEAAIDKAISEMGEVTKKDFGRIMGSLMKELKGKADGSLVKQILTQKLEEK